MDEVSLEYYYVLLLSTTTRYYYQVLLLLLLSTTLSGTCEPSSWPGSKPEVMEGRKVEAVSARRQIA